MCNRYEAPASLDVFAFWKANRTRPEALEPIEVFPRSEAPIVRRAVDDPGYSREALQARWGLIPWFAKSRDLKFSTNNARSEEMANKASFKEPWRRGQRCIIPAISFDEPCWETGKNVWWRFRRTDGAPWGLAGLWSRWCDPETGELIDSYTMLTINADTHPLMSRMHKPDPKLPPDAQDKRSVIPIQMDDVDTWLSGTVAEASKLIRLTPVEDFVAAPAQFHSL